MSGIVLEIVGFVILLTQVKNWVEKRTSKELSKITQEYIDTANTSLPTPDLKEAQKRFNEKIYQRRFDMFGIFFVIIGLVFQLLAILIEKGCN